MKDLKHLIYFENLLQEAQNELVVKAKEEGDYALAYNCYYIPEPFLNLPGCFSSRLRAPRSQNAEVASYYMTNRNCPYTRCILERAIEGGFNYVDALFGAEACSAMERMEEHFELIRPVKNEKFFSTIIDAPMKGDKTNLDYYKGQLKLKVIDKLAENFGVDTSEEAMLKAIEDHNAISKVITEIGDFRKLDNPPITGYEFHVIELVSQVCPHRLILPYLEETLEELKTREPDAKPFFRARVGLLGAEIDDPDFTKLIESCGAMVVFDRYCFGSFPGREPIEIKAGETAFDAICRHYLDTNLCARFMGGEKIDQRHDYATYLAKEFNVDGIIVESMKFCEFWSYEKVLSSHILQNERGIPCCQIEKEYNLGSAGQLRTRFQAFIESLEIKQIQGGAK